MSAITSAGRSSGDVDGFGGWSDYSGVGIIGQTLSFGGVEEERSAVFIRHGV